MTKILVAALAAVVLYGCGGSTVGPGIQTGTVLPNTSEEVIARANSQGAAQRERIAADRGAASAEAMATCAPEICAAISRGELWLGMNEAQVLAATRTSRDAWDIRGSDAKVMGPRLGAGAPRDVVAEVAAVTFQGGSVVGYTYREPQGFRTVSSPRDATQQGRSETLATAMVVEGDGYAAVGDLDRALDRYDRADVIRPNDPNTTYKIAQILDKQERPLQALMRYQLFLHQLEIERIDAQGRAAGQFAEAIAQARQRIIYLERYQ